MNSPRNNDREATTSALMDASLSYLSRFSSSRRNLATHLKKKFSAPTEAELEVMVERCLDRLEELGLLDDARFAEARARGLRARGKSARAIRQRLREKGVGREDVERALHEEDADAELISAVRHAKRRRLGPFRTRETDPRRELGSLARAGFSFEVARRALALSLDDAEAMLAAR